MREKALKSLMVEYLRIAKQAIKLKMLMEFPAHNNLIKQLNLILQKAKKAGLDSRNVKQYEYTNSKGEKVTIRQDKPANYPDGGGQPAHYNAGKNKKLDQHHNC